MTTYTVKKGDTLWRIARTLNLSVQQLMEWNQLTNSLIKVGQVLALVPPPAITYVVKAGDTLWNIASRHNTTILVLKQLNGLTSNLIRVGDVLIISKSNEASTPIAATLIEEAKKYIGTPYKWAGSTPSGFDCSGYLQYVFARMGTALPRTVEGIWDVTIQEAQLKEGNLVFFTTYKPGPSHAGILVNSEQFIHADSTVGVTVTNLNHTYWKPRYLGTRSISA